MIDYENGTFIKTIQLSALMSKFGKFFGLSGKSLGIIVVPQILELVLLSLNDLKKAGIDYVTITH